MLGGVFDSYQCRSDRLVLLEFLGHKFPWKAQAVDFDGSVVITGASGQVGRSTIKALVGRGIQPTGLVRERIAIKGCRIVPAWLDSEQAVTAIGHARTVIHLAGTLNPADGDYERANIFPARRVADAVKRDQTRQLIFLSYVGASERSANRYLATKARAERILKETGVPAIIFRCTHIIGSPENPGPTAAALLATGKKTVRVLGNGRQRIAPVYLGDVVRAIEVAMTSERAGTFDLQGPDEMSFDDLVRLLNGTARVRIAHVPYFIARALSFVGLKLPAALIETMVHDSLSAHATADSDFVLSLTHLRSVWL